MADSTTANYDLVKPEVGASGNTWGGKTNANWDAIDALIAALDVLEAATKVTPILADKIGIIDTETDPDTVKVITLTQLKALIFAAVSLSDAVFELIDNTDGTKKLQFQLSGITTGTTRTITIPNLSGTMALADAVQTLTNKTFTAPVLTDPTIRATNDTATGVVETTEHVTASPAAEDISYQLVPKSNDSGGTLRQLGAFVVRLLDPTAASLDAAWEFWTAVANTVSRRLSIGAGLFMQGATGGDPGAGKINATEVQENGVPLGYKAQYTSGSPRTASGNTQDETGIPSWVTEIIVTGVDLSLNGTDSMLLQLRTAGGVVNTGYAGGSDFGDGSWGPSNGAPFTLQGISSSDLVSGEITFKRHGSASNIWVYTGIGGRPNGDAWFIQGRVDAGDTVTGVRLAQENTNDAYDGGTWSVKYR